MEVSPGTFLCAPRFDGGPGSSEKSFRMRRTTPWHEKPFLSGIYDALKEGLQKTFMIEPQILFIDSLASCDISEINIRDRNVVVCRFGDDDHRLHGQTCLFNLVNIDFDDRLSGFHRVVNIVQISCTTRKPRKSE